MLAPQLLVSWCETLLVDLLIFAQIRAFEALYILAYVQSIIFLAPLSSQYLEMFKQ